jgi:hypothetical protein
MDESKERSVGDWAHGVVKAAVSTVPVAGGPAAELFSFLVAAPAAKRRTQWIESRAARLQSVEERIPGLLASLPDREEWVTAAAHAAQVVTRTHQQEKLEALRNAVVNVATGAAPEVDRQMMFLAWIDSFTPTHLLVLRIAAEGEGRTHASPPSQFSTVRAELADDRGFSDAIVSDLTTRGLLADARPYAARNRESHSPLVSLSWRVTPLGREFLRFIAASG